MRKRHEAALAEDLKDMSDRWHHARRIREFVSAAELALVASVQDDPVERRGWLEWARAYADAIDPICMPDSIAKVVTPETEGFRDSGSDR